MSGIKSRIKSLKEQVVSDLHRPVLWKEAFQAAVVWMVAMALLLLFT